jgi:hypothetical protein
MSPVCFVKHVRVHSRKQSHTTSGGCATPPDTIQISESTMPSRFDGDPSPRWFRFAARLFGECQRSSVLRRLPPNKTRKTVFPRNFVALTASPKLLAHSLPRSASYGMCNLRLQETSRIKLREWPHNCHLTRRRLPGIPFLCKRTFGVRRARGRRFRSIATPSLQRCIDGLHNTQEARGSPCPCRASPDLRGLKASQ